MYKLGVVLLCVLGVWGQSRPEGCGECDPSQCPELDTPCLAGVTMDNCLCCEVCAKAEYEMCDHPDLTTRGYGKCGNDLECLIREDIDPDSEREAICYCMYDEALCGTDGVTYKNMCEMNAAKVSNSDIKKDHSGPCKSAPELVSPPEDVKEPEGSDISLACEAKGYPIPVIEWTWTRVDGETKFLPSDDGRMSVSMRGGPEKWEVSGFLLITDVQKEHEGDYACIAQNENGVDQAMARVKVEDADKKKKDSPKRRRNKNKDGNDL